MRSSHYIEVDLQPNASGSVQIAPLGDFHLGSGTCRTELIQEAVSKAVKEKQYVVGMGDYLEVGTRHSVGAGVYSQSMIPEEQKELCIELLQPLADAGLLLGLIPGNHEQRTFKDDGIDITADLCRALQVPLLGHTCFIYAKVGDQRYDIYATHGSAGATLPHTKVRAALELFKYIDAELVLYAHLHHLAHETIKAFGIDRKNKCIKSMRRNVVLTGSFLGYRGSYAEQKNYMPAKIGYSIINLGYDSHDISVII